MGYSLYLLFSLSLRSKLFVCCGNLLVLRDYFVVALLVMTLIFVCENKRMPLLSLTRLVTVNSMLLLISNSLQQTAYCLLPTANLFSLRYTTFLPLKRYNFHLHLNQIILLLHFQKFYLNATNVK